jgi:nucleotide-binding universal stress UspA family protein
MGENPEHRRKLDVSRGVLFGGGKVIIELAIAEPVVRRTAAGTTIALVAASIFEQPDVLRVVDGAHAGDPTRITILACTCPAPSRVPKLRLSLARGEPASEIVRFAAENSIDLIVLAWSGTLEPDRALAARGVLRSAPCPVMVLRTEPEAKAR